jgi:hypothetical protein
MTTMARVTKPHVNLHPGFCFWTFMDEVHFTGQVSGHPKLGEGRVHSSSIQKIILLKSGEAHIHTRHTIYVVSDEEF